MFLLIENTLLLSTVMVVFRTYSMDSLEKVVPSRELTGSSTRGDFDIPTVKSTYELVANRYSSEVAAIESQHPAQTVQFSMRQQAEPTALDSDPTLLGECERPPFGFKSWKPGVVTTLRPVIRRNCTRILARHSRDINRARVMNYAWNNGMTDEMVLNMTKDCSKVVDYFKDNLYVTKLERSFPVAYSFLIHDSPQQVLRLLKYLYRPMNSIQT